MAAPILLADDDADEAYLLVRAFGEAGVANEVRVVPDGEAAIEYLKRSRPCLALLDQQLPGCSGLDVLQWIRSASPQTTLPVLLLSASTFDADVQAAYLVGANGYLVKPGRHEDTVAMASAIRDYWLRFNRAPSSP